MNFFAEQEAARRSTFWLLLLFLVAICMLLLLSNFLLLESLHVSVYSEFSFSVTKLLRVYDHQLTLLLSAVIIALIVIASFYRLMTLRSGGSAVALSLGGVLIARSSQDPLHRRILNVVEEMSIASGIPTPQVYLLPEHGINAFAAGWKSTNSVIGITQGALEQLTRDELQGVIAHEFSHIFNGDMKLNIRLIAILYGILVIGLLGRLMMRLAFHSNHSRRSKDARAVAILLGIGAALTVVGYSGIFFGGWIKSLISKQREYLADASAVQFTRNNEGIANALKKIGGHSSRSVIHASAAAEYSHGYFALAEHSVSFFSFATHPALEKRILRLEPQWNGDFILSKNKTRAQQERELSAKIQQELSNKEVLKQRLMVGMGVVSTINKVDDIGHINQQTIDLAQQWKNSIPDFIALYAQHPLEAQWLVYAILLDKNESIREQQFEILKAKYKQQFTRKVAWVFEQLSELDEVHEVSVINLTLSSLREMSEAQFLEFKLVIKKLIKADNVIDLKEWMIQRLILQHLEEYFGLREKARQHYYVIGSVKKPIEVVASLLCYLEHSTKEAALYSFEMGKNKISANALIILEKEEIGIKSLNNALDELDQLKPILKKKFLQFAVHCVAHDGEVKLKSYELLRMIASCIDTPLPPVMVKG